MGIQGSSPSLASLLPISLALLTILVHSCKESRPLNRTLNNPLANEQPGSSWHLRTHTAQVSMSGAGGQGGAEDMEDDDMELQLALALSLQVGDCSC